MKKLVKIGFSCILGVLASVSAVGSAPPISPQEKRQNSIRLFQAEVSCELSKLAAETLSSTNSISFVDSIFGLQNMIESSVPRSCLPIYLYYCIEPSHWVSCDGSAQDESVHNQFCPMFCIGLKDIFGSSLHPGGNGIVSLSSSDFSTNSLSIDGFSRLFIHEITNVVEVKFESAHTVQPNL